MTRTERATSPRALMKDRSEAKNGMDASIRKGGAGAHNWGSIEQEARFETELEQDEEQFQAFEDEKAVPKLHNHKGHSEVPLRPEAERKNSVTDEDREKALNVRKNALKSNDLDLTTIARTSIAVSSSPPKDIPIARDANTSTLKADHPQ